MLAALRHLAEGVGTDWFPVFFSREVGFACGADFRRSERAAVGQPEHFIIPQHPRQSGLANLAREQDQDTDFRFVLGKKN